MDGKYYWRRHLTNLLLMDTEGVYNMFAFIKSALMNFVHTSLRLGPIFSAVSLWRWNGWMRRFRDFVSLNIVPIYAPEGSDQIPCCLPCNSVPAPRPALPALGTVNVFDLHQTDRGMECRTIFTLHSSCAYQTITECSCYVSGDLV